MYDFLIKYFFIFLSGFYLFKRLLNLKNKNFIRPISCIIFSLALTFVFFLLKTYFSITYTAFSILIFCLFMLAFFRNNIYLTIITACIAYLISYVIFGCISGISAILSITVLYKLISYPQEILLIFTGVVSYLICHIPFRIKRFKGGMKFLYNHRVQRTGFFLSLFGISIMMFSQYLYYKDPLNNFYSVLCFFVLTFIIIYWWQRNITKSYLDKLRKLELESLRQELEEKDALIRKLTENNDAQARLIHKDNKLIPAMANAVTEYLESSDAESAKEHGAELSEQLKQLAGDRTGILNASIQANSPLPLTGHAGVDAMLSYMNKRSDTEKIAFEVKIHPGFSSRIGDSISEADLSHLLSDLIENAIIATRNSETKQILVHLGILYDVPSVEVSDTGNPFDPMVYQDFGLQKHSTHLDHGGSGIGLMDIWELKKKYAASLHIYEYAPDTAEFAKKITLVFDSKKHYLIRSYRPEELVQMQTRSDLYILPL